MREDLIISKTLSVFEGGLNPGRIKAKSAGRTGDGFVFFLSGGSEYIFDGYSFTAHSDNLIYLARGSVYEMRIAEKSEFICIDFEFDTAMPQKSELFADISPDIKNKFIKALSAESKKDCGYLCCVLSVLYGIYESAVKSAAKPYAKNGGIFAEITAFVLKHYTEPNFTVAEIAEFAGLSEVHIRRIFKNSVNCSPIAYINYLKIEKAKNLLRSSNYSIAETAESVGINDPYYFSRFFKKSTGMSPTDYRRNN